LTELVIEYPYKFAEFDQPARHKVAYGGRGSGKSQGVAQKLIKRGYKERIRCLCTREIQKSIKESVYRLLVDTIDRMGLRGFYQVLDTVIRGANGTEFLFAGLRDHTVESIKSFEGCDVAWVEEANKVTARSANVLIPTIRKDGSEIYWTFNPDQDTDYVYDRFVKNVDPDAIVLELNHRDNPWFPKELRKEMEKLKLINNDLYEHVYGGKLRTVAGIMFKRRWFKWYDTLPKNLSMYLSSDYAGAPDPNEPEREPDFNELGVLGLNEYGDTYAVDWWYDQCDSEVMLQNAITLIRRHNLKIWFEEKGVILRAIDPAITKRLRENRNAHGRPDPVHMHREQLASAGSKAERALGFAARASAGSVYLPRNQPWAERLLNQLCSFTGEDGKVDDGVDVCSLFSRGLDVTMNARTLPAAEKTESVKPFTRRHIEAIEYDEKELARRKKAHYR
jgi:PBSX family phage terminase large subunit